MAEGAIAGEAGIRRGWPAWSAHLFGSITPEKPMQDQDKEPGQRRTTPHRPHPNSQCSAGLFNRRITTHCYLRHHRCLFGSGLNAASPAAPFSFDAVFPATTTGFYVMGGLRTVGSIKTP